jgi:hypothetical protein
MVDSKKLLSDLQTLVTRLEDDLRGRSEEHPEVDQPLQAEYAAAKNKRRTALSYSAWRDEELTQVAVAWVLASVFIRFLEDNELIDTPYLAGPGSRLQRAKDEHEIFFREHPTMTEREYFEKVFNDVGTLPGTKEFFDRKHNPLWQVAPTGDAAKNLLDFWRRTDPETGALVHDFTDPEWKTRFLGDLYQDLSESARKRYALLQTPVFIEQFILDHTLTPAIETFGWQVVRMIDPTCGSGHFLLGGFDRLYRLWQEHRPGDNPRVLAQRALDQVFGVDLNPNVVAIARFRLLLAALRACGSRRLKDAPDFKIHIATGDALLHGRRFRDFEGTATEQTFNTEQIFRDELKHHYEAEDVEALHRILGQQYHAVVGNPPYITVKDKGLNELYRARYLSCSGKYSLSVPFMERFFDLAIKGDGTAQQPAGFVGQITANSFMKRGFGKKLIEQFLPRWDLTHVIDTSGAYIPGHGTPTVILFGKNQPPVSGTIRTVLGIAGEPATPNNPAEGIVWRAIARQVDEPGSVSEWVSAADSLRPKFHKHPWSIGGGGAAELKEQLDAEGAKTLGEVISVTGITAVTGEDDLYIFPDERDLRRLRVESTKTLVTGNFVRDWEIAPASSSIWLSDSDGKILALSTLPNAYHLMWLAKAIISKRKRFGTPMLERGLTWYEWQELYLDKLQSPLSIVFPDVATHNHFSLDRGGKVFKSTAPVIKLPTGTDEATHIRLLGVLNSSSACFWLKQVWQNKGSTVDEHGARQRTAPFEDFYQFNCTSLKRFPIPTRQPSQLPTALVKYSTAVQRQSPAATLASSSGAESANLREHLESARNLAASHRRKLIAWQEELDWQIYEAFGLVEPADGVSLPEGEAIDAIPPEGIQLGERAFEIVLARRIAAGEVQTTWFERHGSTPITELPEKWPAAYRELVERRIRLIADNPNVRLIEQPEYKRRWNTEPWDEQFTKAARDWLLTRLEGYFHEGSRVSGEFAPHGRKFDPTRHGFTAAGSSHLVSANQLAEVVQNDRAFLEVAELYHGSSGFSVAKMVRELVEDESVPYLPVHRYKESGLRARKDWEATWELQRKEDVIEADIRKQHPREPGERLKVLIRKAQQEQIGDIPVPPKYSSKDFQKSSYWRLRGKLDVPKERWITYPGAERDGDLSPLIAWAGWDHLQQAQALAEYYLDAKSNQGWPVRKLRTLLAGLIDLLLWLKQWHNELDPDYGMGLGDYFGGFLEEECRALDLTLDDVNAARFAVTPLQEPEEALT